MRILYYIRNPSLSIDESFIALNLVTRDPSELFETLDFNQGAPFGFLQGQKLILLLFDASELALRGLPLVAGLAGLVLFTCLARRLLDDVAAVVAVGIFSGSTGLVLYATTAKQYASDVAIASAILLLADRTLTTPSSRTSWITLGIVGVAAPWLSHPAMFVLAGVAATLIAHCFIARTRLAMARPATLAAVWTINVLLAYQFEIRALEGLRATLTGQSGSLVETTLEGSPKGVITFLQTVVRALRDAFGIPQILVSGLDLGDIITILLVMALVAGLVILVQRAPFRTLLLISPVPPFVLAAAVDEYPVFPRTLLFLLPSLIPILSVAIAALISRIIARRYQLGVAAALAAGAVLITPVFGLVDRFRDDPGLKPVLRRLTYMQHPDEALYIFFATQYGFRYYATCGCFDVEDIARGQTLWPIVPTHGSRQWAAALRSVPPHLYVGRRVDLSTPEFEIELRRLHHRERVWFLVSDVSASERDALLTMLSRHGRILATIGPFSTGTAAAYLVDLRNGALQSRVTDEAAD